MKGRIFLVEKSDFGRLKNQFHNSKYQEALERGFGLSFGNYTFFEKDNVNCHMIIINKDICDMALLNEEEQVAVTLHELGHLLNEYEIYIDYQKHFVASLKNWQPGAPALISKADANQMNEIYADSFAKAHGYGTQIRGALEKYAEKIDNSKREEFVNRLEKLSDSTLFEGRIKQLNSLTA